MKLSEFNFVCPNGDGALVMNVRSGGILSLNRDYFQSYMELESAGACDAQDLVDELCRGGMLISDERDERVELMLQSRAARFANTSLNLTIAPTMGCNFCCPYCYERGQAHTSMSDSIMNQLAEFVKSYYPDIAHLNIGWYGGEPLLALDKIKRITELLDEATGDTCELAASIVTNGYLLTPVVAGELARCGVINAQVTIDGSRADHDMRRILHDGTPTYDRILANIAQCADILDISVRTNVDKANISAASELLDYLEKHELKNKVHFYLAPVDDVNGVCINANRCFTIEEFSREETVFYQMAIERGFKVQPFGGANFAICCAVTMNSFVVDPLGDLYKCWDDIGMAERKVGTIFEPPALNANMIRWMSYEPSDAECADCFAFPMCMGGCPNHFLHGKKKQCVSFKYDTQRKMLLSSIQAGM